MRILFCNKYNFPFSGTEVYLFELMELMRGQGHEVALFSMADPRGIKTEYDEFFLPHMDFKKGGQGLLARARLAAHAVYSTEARRRLRGMIAAFKPDIAHVRNIYHHLSPSILWELKARGIPVLYHLNDFKLLCPTYNMVAKGSACEMCRGGRFGHVVTSGCYTGGREEAMVLAAEAYVHKWIRTYEKCVSHFLTPSRFAREKLVQNGFDPSKISDLRHFQKLPAETPAAADTDAPILYFGRLSAEKGVSDLVQAMAHVPKVRLLIAGEGPERGRLETLARELSLESVEFLGYAQGADLEAKIASARFTVMPSHAYETMGKTILESYAWGRPVIASDLGSRRELVRDRVTGLLFQPGNVEQLATAVTFLVEHPHLAEEMGAAGRRMVEAEHSPEAHYLELMKLYRQMQVGGFNPRHKRVAPDEKTPVRVAFIGGRGVISKYSGIEAYYEEVGKRLAAMGNEVTVYCRSYFTPPVAMHEGMRVIRLPTIRSKHLDTPVHSFLSTMHAVFSRCELVHYHAQGSAVFSFLPRLFGKKTIITIQGLDWKRKKWGRVASLALRLAEQAALRLPNATIVVSSSLQEHYRESYGIETQFVPNGSVIRQRRALSQMRELGLQTDNYILYMGRFSPEKNCHLLLDAYQRIDTPAKLVFAGGSSHTDSYIAGLRRHQSDRIRFLDWVSGDAFDELLTNAAVFILPSDLEGLSLALLDAMGAGVCVLTSDIPENREVVDGVGFTFRAGDVDDLERMLRLLLSDAAMRRMAARSAQNRVRERYLWGPIAERVEEIYRGLAGKAGVGEPAGNQGLGSVDPVPPKRAA
jgi:glycosyltransferase involved in cell wall biosynthesis